MEDSGIGNSFTTLEDRMELFSISIIKARTPQERKRPVNPAQNGERFRGAVKNANINAEMIKLHHGK